MGFGQLYKFSPQTNRRRGRMPDLRRRVNVFGWNRLFERHQLERPQRFRDFLAGRSIVAVMHIAGKIHVGRNGIANMRNMR